MLITLFYNEKHCIIAHTNPAPFYVILMNTGILSHIDLILFYKAQDLKCICNEVTVNVLKSPNRRLKTPCFLTALISPCFCILNTALLSYTPPT
jgi:hypothetical protein